MKKIISLILLALYSAPIKTYCQKGGFSGAGSGSGFGGSRGFNGGSAGRTIGLPEPPPILPPPTMGNGPYGLVLPPPIAIGTGYRGGQRDIPALPGGDVAPAVVVIPNWKYDPTPAAPGKIPIPTVPTQVQPRRPCGRGPCINKYIYGGIGGPKKSSPCCAKFKEAIECMCRFYQSLDTKKDNAARAIFRGCRIPLPQCPSKLYRLN